MSVKKKHNHNRGHISIPGELYWRFQAFADKQNRSMAELADGQLVAFLDRAEADARLDA